MKDTFFNKNTLCHVLLMTVTALVCFGTSWLWTAPYGAEAEFFLGLKTAISNGLPCHALALRWLGFLAGLTDFGRLWPLRLFSGLCAWVIMLCTYFSARKLYGGATGLTAALTLSTVPIFVQFGVSAWPAMFFAALTTLPLTIWLTADTSRPLSWVRWSLIWLFALPAVFNFGLTAVFVILIFFTCNLLTLPNKRQHFFTPQTFAPLTGFVAVLVIWGWVTHFYGEQALFSTTNLLYSITGLLNMPYGMSWLSSWGYGFLVLGVWLPILGIIVAVLIIKKISGKPLAIPHLSLLVIWFLAVFIPAFIAGYENAGKFLCAVPPVAVFMAYCLNSWIKSFTLQTGDLRVASYLFAIWGVVICVLAVYLFFNLELAWQREVYLETGSLLTMLVAGLVILFLSLLKIWFKHGAYAFLGFTFTLLLSLTFLFHAVWLPSRDVLYSSFYFNYRLERLAPDIAAKGVTFGILPDVSREAMMTKYFTYAGYSVALITLSPGDTADWPDHIILDDFGRDYVGMAQIAGEFEPVYWERVDGNLLTVFVRTETASGTAEDSPPMSLVWNSRETEADGNPSPTTGFFYTGGYLIPFAGETALIDGPRIVSANVQSFREFGIAFPANLSNPHSFHWLRTASRHYSPLYSGIRLHNQTGIINTSWPYSARFQNWAVTAIINNAKSNYLCLSGLAPDDEHTRHVLGRLLAIAPSRLDAVTKTADSITLDKGLLQFFAEERRIFLLELRKGQVTSRLLPTT